MIAIFVADPILTRYMTRFHLNAFLTLCLAALPACACLQRAETPSVGLDYVEIDGKTPSDLLRWNAAAFVFDTDKCIYLKQSSSLSDLSKIETVEGDSLVIVAYPGESSNLAFTALKAGRDKSEYRLTTVDGTPLTGKAYHSAEALSSDAAVVSTLLSPLNSTIAFNVEGSPESVVLSVDGLSNEYVLSLDSLYAYEHSRFEFTRGGEYDVFPVEDRLDETVLNLEFKLAGETYNHAFAGVPALRKGQKLTIDLDVSRFVSENVYGVGLVISDFISGETFYTQSKAYSTLDESRLNRHYALSVYSDGRWKSVQVYDALCSDASKHGGLWNDWSNSRALRDTMSYAIFEHEFNEPVRVRVTKLSDGDFSSCVVRPSTYEIKTSKIDGNSVEFVIPALSMGKLSVEFDGDRHHNLFIYGYAPDKSKPSASDPKVHYYGPGVHTPGTIELSAGETLYIDYGAKVYANVITNGDNVTIAGHGILSGEQMQHYGDNLYSYGDFLMCCNKTGYRAKNLTIKDITMIDSPGWNMLLRCTDGVVVDGVNMISWELNGDGIDVVSCTDVEISNCFLRNYDDCITLKCRFIVSPITDVTNVRIHDCLIWNDYARGIVVGPEAGNLANPGYIHDIKIWDCIFLEHGSGQNSDLRAAFAIGQGSDGKTDLWSGSNPPRTISDITVSGLVFDNIGRNGRAVSIWQYKNSSIVLDNITLSDFKVLDSEGNKYPALSIITNGASIKGLNIKNFTVNGTKVLSTGDQFYIDNPSNVNYTIQ